MNKIILMTPITLYNKCKLTRRRERKQRKKKMKIRRRKETEKSRKEMIKTIVWHKYYRKYPRLNMVPIKQQNRKISWFYISELN